jgi:hypothetical protein
METTMTTEIKPTQTDRIRTLNDELRKDFNQGHAVMTIGIAALGAEAVARIVKTVEVYDDFATPTTPTKNMTLARSKPKAIQSFSKLIITIPH